MKRPWIIAHRGDSVSAPENTLAAFEKALRTGVDGVELDIWQCGSGEIVVTHDQDLQRITGRPGNVEQLSLRELKQRDFGSWKDKKFLNEKIPTLEEVLDLLSALPLINIEIKSEKYKSNGVEKSLIKILRAHQLEDQILVSSFNPGVLRRIKKMHPTLRRGLLLTEGSSLPLRRAWLAPWVKPYSIHPSISLLNKALVRKTHKKIQKIIAWTINKPHQLERCMQLEVDGMITDDPAWLRGELKK